MIAIVRESLPLTSVILPVPAWIFSLNVNTIDALDATLLVFIAGLLFTNVGAIMSTVSKANEVPLNLLPDASVITVLANLTV